MTHTAIGLAGMATQLLALPVAPPPYRDEIDGDSKTARLRQLLRDEGPQTAHELAATVGLKNSGLVGALLKADLHAGRVSHVNGRYRWNADYVEGEPKGVKPGQLREVLVWHEVADGDFPDADLTVIVRMVENEEPVWLGFWDGEEWRDTEGHPIDVVRWTEIPKGER